MAVALDGFEHFQPGTVLYRGLVLSDPETGAAVFRCRLLKATWTRVVEPQGPPKTVVLLSASQGQIEAAGIPRLGQLLDRILQNQGDWADVEFRLAAGELQLLAGRDSQTLGNVAGAIEAIRGGVQACAVFRLPGAATPQPLKDPAYPQPPGDAARQRMGTRYRRQLAAVQPVGHRLGRTQAAGSTEPLLRAPLGQRDARRLGCPTRRQIGGPRSGRPAGRTFSPQAQRPGRTQHRLVRLWQGRIEKAAGTLRAGPGLISSSLVHAAVEQLHLVATAEPKASDELLSYEQLALSFRIDGSGLRLHGGCTGATTGAVLSGPGVPLLAEPVAQPQPLAALIQALVPASQFQVPATPQTGWLARWLPLPEAAARPDTPPAPPQAHLRLGRCSMGNRLASIQGTADALIPSLFHAV